MSITHTDITRIMGPAAITMDHPMWREVDVLNGIYMMSIWIDEKAVWSGIARQDSPALHRLRLAYPDAEVSCMDLEAGIHY